ncbi:unnamed protein product, partial [marine sediment metagenome]
VPKYAHAGDAGLDLYSSINCELRPFERKKDLKSTLLTMPQKWLML